MTFTQIDREYDRELARLNRVARMRGDRSVQFVTPEVILDEVIDTGREELGHPSTWNPEAEEDQLVIDEAGLCGKRLHFLTPDNLTNFRKCRACFNIERRRKRAADNGNPLCWTGTHPEPAGDSVCPCGDVPPPFDDIDWAAVEGAIACRPMFRPLTPAEELCCLVTVSDRWGGGLYDARTWLWDNTAVMISTRRVEYLTEESDLLAIGADAVFFADLEINLWVGPIEDDIAA